MINNLFSIFDPSSISISSAWIITPISITVIFQTKSKTKNKLNLTIKLIKIKITKEIKPLLANKNFTGKTIIFISLFSIITLINITALIPFTFTPTAHITVNFPTALTIWTAIIVLGWSKNTKSIIAHTVPTGTPTPLINFIIIIEITRNIIRPLTLSIRLTANIVAGHLLLSLLRSFILRTPSTSLIYPTEIILSMLELGVALIQAYVFITLLILYSTEVY
jgi:F-type H+-transporting ATPase subunit a